MTIAPLAAITAAAAALRLWAFGSVPGNVYYDAAARSMSLSWHNFFFGAYEPGAQVAVDKAPADLWLQVASVKLFGFSAVATRLPEVAAGVLAVPLVYDLVRRLFGRRAGLIAAAALAVLPVAILTAHSDTMDSVMMLLDVLAAWLVVVGAQSRKAWPVVAAGAVLGLAFNVKLFEALIALPAIAVLMLLAVDLPVRRKMLALGGSLAAFVAVSLSWIVAASMTALGGRPWPIGSTDGSIWNVVFVFNGYGRVSTPASAGVLALDPPGPLRFLHGGVRDYPTMVGTMLLAAVVLGGAAAAVALLRRRGVTRWQLAGAAFLGTWLVVGAGLLTFMQRLSPRYLEAVTPAIAAVTGVGLAALVAGARPTRPVLVGALAVVAAGGALIAHPPAWAVVLALAAVAGCAILVVRGPRAGLAILSAVAVLAIPASGALAVAAAHKSDAGLPPPTTDTRVTALSRYLTEHDRGARYEVASSSVVRAAPLIVRDARPVLMLTSLYGRPLLSGPQLQRLVASGQVRYLLGSSACSPEGCADVFHWVRSHARDVSAAAGQPRGTLYRLTAPGASAKGT